jgi:hypothetical protein
MFSARMDLIRSKDTLVLQLHGSEHEEKESISVLFTVQCIFYAARTTSNAPKLLPQRAQWAPQYPIPFELNCDNSISKVTFRYGQ